MEWGQEQTRNDVVVTDEQVKSKALEIAEELNIEPSVFKASAGWLENFKNRGKYSGGKFDLQAVPPLLSKEASGENFDGEAVGNSGPGTPFIDHQPEQASSTSLRNRLSIGQEAVDSASSPSSSSTSTTGYYSPRSVRRQKRSTLSSLSSSSLSLPDLVEREEQRPLTTGNSSSSVDLQSGRSSFVSLHMRPLNRDSMQQQHSSASVSADSSPFPSPTCSAGSDTVQTGEASLQSSMPGSGVQTSTPTQRTLYNNSHTPQSGDFHVASPDSGASSHSRLQQAGINFSLSLNASPHLLPHASKHQLPTISSGQPLDLRNSHGPHTESPARYDGVPFTSHDLGAQRNTVYSSRSRTASAGGTTGYYHQQQHPAMSLTMSDSTDNMPQMAYSAYSSHSGSPVLSGHLSSQHKSPLHRSATDPMPLYLGMGLSQHHQVFPGDEMSGVGDSTITQSSGASDSHESPYMDVDQTLSQAFTSATPFQESQYYLYQGHSTAHCVMPRRATVSSAGDLSFSSSAGSGQGHARGHSYSSAVVTTPSLSAFPGSTDMPSTVKESTTTSLSEAYVSLRKVIGFLQDTDPSTSSHANLVDASQLTTLETVLAQLRHASISQVPALAPPRST